LEGYRVSIDVKLFGDLREKVSRTDESGYVGVYEASSDEVKKIGDILELLDLDYEEISHMFLNHSYSDVDSAVVDGDRVAIFPRNMALLYRWYFKGGFQRHYVSKK
jgi:molybdopterin converting factor small subunit